MDEAVKVAEGVADYDQTAAYDISKIDFGRLKREFERVKDKRTTVQNLKEAIFGISISQGAFTQMVDKISGSCQHERKSGVEQDRPVFPGRCFPRAAA